MNAFIEEVVNLGLGKTFYDVFFALGFVSVFLFVFYIGRKMDVKAWKIACIVLTVYPLTVLWMMILYWLETGFFGGNNIVRVFVYVPVIAYPMAKTFELPYKKVLSMVALGPAAVHAVSHYGCMFEGCCCGYIQDWGLYNPITGKLHFPSQPIEATAALLIVFYLLYRAKKRNYVPDGLEYPLMLALFGSSRFIFEFLRDNEKIWLGCSSLAFHALFMFVVGVIWIIVAKKKSEKELKIF
ncbi:MAG: prolipoprotein diacylglyceryl transferase [Oscillospiraceae bacterium]|nr:prolipoprotein diacylglyceryl transferase [Oscillospiraceae bacterium]MBQ3501010.1 prolipoprotein diacylglyceryl transferase [Oscillospiraceae bacterium]MBQ4642861.1 prolipoprotein diacylglyceryl transferase [Oscillospiraceae bacterium]